MAEPSDFKSAAAECPRPSQPPVYRTVQFRGGCNLRSCDVKSYPAFVRWSGSAGSF